MTIELHDGTFGITGYSDAASMNQSPADEVVMMAMNIINAQPPVKWPDGAEIVQLRTGATVKIVGDKVSLSDVDGVCNDAAIRQLAALMIAACDYIEENE